MRAAKVLFESATMASDSIDFSHRIAEALAFDDVLLVPSYSQILPTAVSTVTRLTREISLNIPLVSAAMALSILVGLNGTRPPMCGA